MKHYASLVALAIITSPLSAQTADSLNCNRTKTDKKILNHLTIGVVGGTTGLGLDLSMPVGNMVQLRAGFEAMPRFSVDVNFPVTGMVKKDGKWQSTDLTKATSLLTQLTGYEAKDNVDMTCRPLYYNFKFLVDVYPFRNKKWHVTAGFYYGNSKIAEAYNTTEDMPTLFALSMYNNIYSKVQADPDYFYNNPIYVQGNGSEIFLDPDVVETLNNTLAAYGKLGVHVGDYSHDIQSVDEKGNPVFDEDGNPVYEHRKGDPYLMTPDKNSMVKACVKVNRFKPYIGFGYGTDLRKSTTGWGVSFDAGLLFWGGKPSLQTYDGTDLINDLENVNGKVGTYVDVIKKFTLFPVINVHVTKLLF